MRVLHFVGRAVTAGGILLILASPAEAQWYVGGLFGANRTQQSIVTVDAPAQGLSQQFHDVHYEAKPFSSPPYYGWRVGRVVARTPGVNFAVEVEFIHAKVYADTARTYVVTPLGTGAPATSFAAMDATVQRFQMTHGLNFVLANLVMQAPLRRSGDGPVRLDLRVGVGPTIPHAESTVLGESREQYEYGGMAFDGGIGVHVRLAGRVSALAEYQVTFAHPEITLAHGTGRATTLMHHLIAGLTFRLTD